MKLICLDLEGVLIPEIWLHVADRTQVQGLRLTTRDVKDYRELMERRVEVCQENGITLENIREYIAELPCMDGAREFLDWARARYQVVILSDTFYGFADHFMKLLGYPTLFCHTIRQNRQSGRLEFSLRQENAKAEAVKAFRSLNFRVLAAGDSYNDIHMLKEAHTATFFRAPEGINKEFPQYGNIHAYADLQRFIEKEL